MLQEKREQLWKANNASAGVTDPALSFRGLLPREDAADDYEVGSSTVIQSTGLADVAGYC